MSFETVFGKNVLTYLSLNIYNLVTCYMLPEPNVYGINPTDILSPCGAKSALYETTK